MRHLFIKNRHVFQDRREITASEKRRIDAGYDPGIPCYNADIGDFPKAKYRFLILTFTEDAHLDEDTRPGPNRKSRLCEIWDYAKACGIHDIYVLPGDGMIVRRYTLMHFVSFFPHDDEIRLHLCTSSKDYYGIKIGWFMEVRKTRQVDCSLGSVEAVEEGSKFCLVPDEDFPDGADGRQEMSRLEQALLPMSETGSAWDDVGSSLDSRDSFPDDKDEVFSDGDNDLFSDGDGDPVSDDDDDPVSDDDDDPVSDNDDDPVSDDDDDPVSDDDGDDPVFDDDGDDPVFDDYVDVSMQYDALLFRILYTANQLFSEFSGIRYLFLKGWNEDLMQIDDFIFLPVHDCVDVCVIA